MLTPEDLAEHAKSPGCMLLTFSLSDSLNSLNEVKGGVYLCFPPLHSIEVMSLRVS